MFSIDDLVFLVALHIRSLVILKYTNVYCLCKPEQKYFGAALGKGRQAAKTYDLPFFFSISNVLFASCSVAITCECIKHSQQILIASIKAHIIKTLLTEK